jgi:hypothetical protein
VVGGRAPELVQSLEIADQVVNPPRATGLRIQEALDDVGWLDALPDRLHVLRHGALVVSLLVLVVSMHPKDFPDRGHIVVRALRQLSCDLVEVLGEEELELGGGVLLGQLPHAVLAGDDHHRAPLPQHVLDPVPESRLHCLEFIFKVVNRADIRSWGRAAATRRLDDGGGRCVWADDQQVAVDGGDARLGALDCDAAARRDVLPVVVIEENGLRPRHHQVPTMRAVGRAAKGAALGFQALRLRLVVVWQRVAIDGVGGDCEKDGGPAGDVLEGDVDHWGGGGGWQQLGGSVASAEDIAAEEHNSAIREPDLRAGNAVNRAARCGRKQRRGAPRRTAATRRPPAR